MIPHDAHAQNLATLLAPIAELLRDPEVSEIMINGPCSIYAERRGRIERTACTFGGERGVLAALRGLAQYAGRSVSREQPILEARLPDGSRVEAVLPPAAPNGPLISIRRMSQTALTLADLSARGALDEDGVRVLGALVEQRRNVLIAGGTGSGKTAVLGALAALIPHDERIVVIEDSRELSLRHEHAVQLEAQPADARGRGEVTIRQLFKATLRLRPDRIVVGEIRSGEALDLVQAMTSGHGGCLSTIHATTPSDALSRLETLALMNDVQLPLHALRAQIGSAIDAIVQTVRLHDGRRRIGQVVSVTCAGDGGGYALETLYDGRAKSPLAERSEA